MIAAAVLFGLAANADNLAVGIAYGVQCRRIRVQHNLLIAFATTAVTYAALLAGSQLHRHLLPALPNWLGGALLVVLAIAGFLRPNQRTAEAAASGVAGPREVAVLAGALSVNNIGLAIAGGFAGLHYGLALAAIFCFSVSLLSAGLLIGEGAGRRVARTLRQAWIGNAILLTAGLAMLSGR